MKVNSIVRYCHIPETNQFILIKNEGNSALILSEIFKSSTYRRKPKNGNNLITQRLIFSFNNETYSIIYSSVTPDAVIITKPRSGIIELLVSSGNRKKVLMFISMYKAGELKEQVKKLCSVVN